MGAPIRCFKCRRVAIPGAFYCDEHAAPWMRSAWRRSLVNFSTRLKRLSEGIALLANRGVPLDDGDRSSR